MSNSQKLKDRFSKLQVQIKQPIVAEPIQNPLDPELASIQLPLSLQPELHQSLRTSVAEKLNWKKILRSKNDKITVTSKSDLISLMLERTIQQVAKKNLTVSVCLINPEELEILDRLTVFLKSRINLFKDMFDHATVCLVRVHKNRPVIEVNSFEAAAQEFIRQRLELEAARTGGSLNSFQIDTKEGWLSISFAITEKPFRSFEEISQ